MFVATLLTNPETPVLERVVAVRRAGLTPV